jgi:anti-sigma factor RsiW
MPDAEKLTLADPTDLAAALVFALRYQGRKPVHNAACRKVPGKPDRPTPKRAWRWTWISAAGARSIDQIDELMHIVASTTASDHRIIDAVTIGRFGSATGELITSIICC